MKKTPYAALAVSALVGATLVATTTTGASAGTASVPFSGCELTLDGIRQSGAESTFTPTLTVDYPSPVQVFDARTMSTTSSAVPGGIFPGTFDNPSVRLVLTYSTGPTGPEVVFTGDQVLASYDGSQPLPLDDLEQDVEFGSSGRYDLRPREIAVEVLADQDGDADLEYYIYSCDVVPPSVPPLLQVGVFDPTAAASIALDRLEVQQGEVVGITGRDFEAELVEAADLDVTTQVGTTPATAFDADDIGSFGGALQVPEFARPGTAVRVTASSAGELAEAFLTVRALPDRVVVPGTARAGKALRVTGSAFKPGESVRLVLKGGRGKGTRTFRATAPVAADGTFSRSVTLRKAAKGTWRVSVAGPESFRSARGGFRVR